MQACANRSQNLRSIARKYSGRRALRAALRCRQRGNVRRRNCLICSRFPGQSGRRASGETVRIPYNRAVLRTLLAETAAGRFADAAHFLFSRFLGYRGWLTLLSIKRSTRRNAGS